MERFRSEAARSPATAQGAEIADSAGLHAWSVRDPAGFWAALFDHVLPGVERSGPAFTDERGPSTVWFPDTQLNVAEVILGGLGAPDGAVGDSDPMFISLDERGRRAVTTRGEAIAEVAAIAAALRSEGIGPGDRVAVWMPNTARTNLVMLAAASIGAVFSSTSPDFGADGVLDRFSQIEPKVLVAVDGYTYGGRPHRRLEQLAEIMAGLPSLSRTVVLPFLEDDPDLAMVGGATGAAVGWEDWLSPHLGTAPEFTPLHFDHPWYILFSSGTTGVPKCIVHRSGGVLLQHLKEQQLHLDIRPGDKVCYFTTAGWMMWNWLASAGASGATTVLYDGNPFHPGPEALWELASSVGLEFLGVSAKYLDSVKKSGYVPAESVGLSSLRVLASTGSPLVPETFEWTYSAVAPACDPSGLHVASISGGTDLCGCFVGGDPTLPVFSGEIQAPALGMDVDVLDERGEPAAPGVKGELVCRGVFPSMPLGFWNDGPLGEVGPRYEAAYFERFDGLWAQGDFATWTEHGGMVIHGRSDTTLNPGGVRIGTAEIYRQVEQIPEVQESLVFGADVDGDVEVVLLVRLTDSAGAGATLSEELVGEIKNRIRSGCSPRHVPARILAVNDLPRTRSGKLAELAVSDVVNGRPVRNTTALANPESLDEIANLF